MTHVLMTADAVGGVWTYALELARTMAPYGVRTTIASMGRRPSPDQIAEARSIPDLQLESSDFALEWKLDSGEPPWDDVCAAGRWLLRLASSLRPDVVHLNGYAHAVLPFGAPTVVVGHSCVSSWREATGGCIDPVALASYGRVVRAGVRAADWVIAPTRAMLAALERHYEARPQTAVIPNGLDADRFDSTEKQPLVATAGRLWDRAKNVAAVRAVAPQLPWPVVVAGAEAADAAPAPHCEVLDLLGRASIFALPARYEPFGLLPLEAALSGCALVLGDIESLREVWADAAVYVDPDDRPALRAAIEKLIADPPYLRDMAGAARRRASIYSSAAMGRRYVELYRDLVDCRRCA